MDCDKQKYICRFCLEIVEIGHSIFNEDIYKIVKNFTSLEISDSDYLPKEACSKCIINIYFINNIRNKFIKSHEKLEEVYQKYGNFNLLLEESNLFEFDTVDVLQIKNEQVDKMHMIKVVEDVTEEESKPKSKTKVKPKVHRKPSSRKVSKYKVHDIELPKTTSEVEDKFDEEMNNLDNIIFRKTDEEPYVYHCKVCNVDMVGSREFKNHKAKHTKRTCKECGVTIRKDNFKKHTLIHALGKQICDICGTEHKSFESLRTHNFHFHNNNKKEYKCEECNLTFKYRHRWNHHNRKVHTGDRPYQCDQCGKKFFTLETIKRHVDLVHLKLRDFVCKYCKKGYSTRYALMVHTRQHTNETPYSCEICGEGFRQNVSLRTHKKSKHGIVVETKKEAQT